MATSSTPPIVGPMKRARLNCTLFSVAALRIVSLVTRNGIVEIQAGMKIA